MTDAAIIGINCDGWCNPAPPAVVQARHWEAWGKTVQPVPGVAEDTQADHAECGRLATASIVGTLLPIPDNATSEQIAAVVNAHPECGWTATVTYAPIVEIVGTSGPVEVYNCWPGKDQPVNVSECHNPQMGTVLLSRIAVNPAPVPSQETDDMAIALVQRDDNAQDPHGPDAVYLVEGVRLKEFIPMRKRHVGTTTDLAPYEKAGLVMEKISGFMLDRAEDGPVDTAGNYPVAQ